MNRRRAQSATRVVLSVGGALLVVVAVAAAVLHFVRPVVTVTEAVTGPVVQAFYSTGTIQPEREYPIKSNTAGILIEVKVDKGDRVHKDQILAVVSDPSLVYARDKARAELEEKLARADEKSSPVLGEFDSRIAATSEMLDIARREETRLKDARQTNAASPSAMDQASSHVNEVVSLFDGLKAQRAAKKLELNREVEV